MNVTALHRALAGAAIVLGALAAVTSRPSRPRPAGIDVAALARTIDREEDHVTALELAQWIRDRKPGLRVLDVRSDSEYATYHIPSSEHVTLDEIATLRPTAHETLVLYSEGGAHAAQAWVLLRATGFDEVFFLQGGLLEWMDDVMNPVVTADAEGVRALSRYFGGTPREPSARDSVPNATPVSARAVTAAAAVRALRRRGC